MIRDIGSLQEGMTVQAVESNAAGTEEGLSADTENTDTEDTDTEEGA